MKSILWLKPIMLSSALILSACEEGRNVPTPKSESAPGAAASRMPNSDAEKAIRAKLESDEAIKQANLSVSIDAAANKATVSGQVASQDIKNKAIDLAKSAQPELTIEDKIDVKPAA